MKLIYCGICLFFTASLILIKIISMFKDKKIVVVMPAYNAEKTLEMTYAEIPFDLVDEVIIVDDHSRDNTYTKAVELGIRHVIRHDRNKGYGGTRKPAMTRPWNWAPIL